MAGATYRPGGAGHRAARSRLKPLPLAAASGVSAPGRAPRRRPPSPPPRAGRPERRDPIGHDGRGGPVGEGDGPVARAGQRHPLDQAVGGDLDGVCRPGPTCTVQTSGGRMPARGEGHRPRPRRAGVGTGRSMSGSRRVEGRRWPRWCRGRCAAPGSVAQAQPRARVLVKTPKGPRGARRSASDWGRRRTACGRRGPPSRFGVVDVGHPQHDRRPRPVAARRCPRYRRPEGTTVSVPPRDVVAEVVRRTAPVAVTSPGSRSPGRPRSMPTDQRETESADPRYHVCVRPGARTTAIVGRQRRPV